MFTISYDKNNKLRCKHNGRSFIVHEDSKSYYINGPEKLSVTRHVNKFVQNGGNGEKRKHSSSRSTPVSDISTSSKSLSWSMDNPANPNKEFLIFNDLPPEIQQLIGRKAKDQEALAEVDKRFQGFSKQLIDKYDKATKEDVMKFDKTAIKLLPQIRSPSIPIGNPSNYNPEPSIPGKIWGLIYEIRDEDIDTFKKDMTHFHKDFRHFIKAQLKERYMGILRPYYPGWSGQTEEEDELEMKKLKAKLDLFKSDPNVPKRRRKYKLV